MKRLRYTMLVLGWLWLGAAGAIAQDSPAADTSAIGEAMVEYFGTALRTELGLEDVQVDAIVPLVREMGRERTRIHQERVKTLRELRQAWRGGAEEARLRELLERAEGLESQELERRRELQAQIDTHLGIREQVQFRFFSQRFRRRVQQRITEIRGGAAAGARPFRRDRAGRRQRPGG